MSVIKAFKLTKIDTMRLRDQLISVVLLAQVPVPSLVAFLVDLSVLLLVHNLVKPLVNGVALLSITSHEAGNVTNPQRSSGHLKTLAGLLRILLARLADGVVKLARAWAERLARLAHLLRKTARN